MNIDRPNYEQLDEEELREYEYHVESQLESIARFKKIHPNGAKIYVGDFFDIKDIKNDE